MTTIASRAWPIALSMALGCLAGCAPNPGMGVVDGGWPWRPVAIRVHELTRITRPDEAGVREVNVRIEFLDVAGDPAKASGTLQARVTRVNEHDDPPYVEVDLGDVRMASAHFERVTATYLLRVRPDLPGLVAGRRVRIEAIYTTADGGRLVDVRTLTWPATP